MLNSAVSYDEIVDSFFKKGYYNRVECTKIVDKCIELNILTKTDSINNHYAFDHETYQDYFIAVALDEDLFDEEIEE